MAPGVRNGQGGHILFLRHGEIRPPRPGTLVGRLDLPLTAAGREQAAVWGRTLAGLPLAAAAASPLVRARQTAAIVLADRGMAAEVWPELAEIDIGAWQGRTRQEVEEQDPRAWADRGHDLAGYQPPGGESFADLVARVAPAVDRLAALAGGGTVLAVAHAGVIRAAVAAGLGLSPARLLDLGQAYAALTVLAVRGGGLALAALNLPPGTDPRPFLT